LVLFGMQNRTFGPYLAAMHRILISAMEDTNPIWNNTGTASFVWPPVMVQIALYASILDAYNSAMECQPGDCSLMKECPDEAADAALQLPAVLRFQLPFGGAVGASSCRRVDR
jgi:hypothetical protein